VKYRLSRYFSIAFLFQQSIQQSIPHGNASAGFTSLPEASTSAQNELSASTEDNKINVSKKGLLKNPLKVK
jgi:hypothetical protein